MGTGDFGRHVTLFSPIPFGNTQDPFAENPGISLFGEFGVIDVQNARGFYEAQSAAATSVVGIFFYDSVLDFLPETQAELGVHLVTAVIPGPLDNAAVAGLKTAKISGFTRHGLNQAISREGHGVASRAMLDAVRNPLKVARQANGTFRFIGRDATVVLNQNGRVVTTWATSTTGLRLP